jgi:tetratricopeptide (TPR) repeat protein
MDAVDFGIRTLRALILIALFAGEGAVASGPSAWPPPMDPVLQAAWEKGLELEKSESFAESNKQYELLARALPSSATIRWRVSRNYWRLGERLPTDDKKGRMEWFRVSERWADEALRADPECGECVLWKVASMGRIATTGGVIEAAGSASEVARLIDYGIALRPSHADNERNVTLANLYYAGAAFYRVVPDWFWLGLVIGVRGDNQRALEYIRSAIEISGARIDYQVELGAVLLCIGHDDGDERRLAEGRQVLEQAVALADFQSTDHYDREHAHILMAEPDRACGYSRDGWVDLSEAVR